MIASDQRLSLAFGICFRQLTNANTRPKATIIKGHHVRYPAVVVVRRTKGRYQNVTVTNFFIVGQYVFVESRLSVRDLAAVTERYGFG